MNRKEKILGYLKSPEYIPLKFAELMVVLDVPGSDRPELESILSELLHEGKIFITKRGRYMALPTDMVAGTLRCGAQRRLNFVTPDEGEDIYIPDNACADALNGDRVLVFIDRKKTPSHHAEGHITKVLSRANTSISGVVKKLRGKHFIIEADDFKIHSTIKVSPGLMNGAVPGDRVLLGNIRAEENGVIFAAVTEILGKSDDINSNINAIIAVNNIKKEFDAKTLDEADSLSSAPDKTDFAGRLDLRENLIFTIDGDDAKDFDDAVGIEKTETGWRLGVHIADVTHYVKAGSSLDTEAYARGTSVYFPGRVIPMLPEKLSAGLCSLKPHEDRLTLSVIMEINKNGEVLGHTLTESVICSKYRLTYNNVNKLLAGDKELSEEYKDISETLKAMEELASVLNKKRKDRGAVNLDFPESSIRVDKDGYPTDIGLYERGVSNRMIEEFMLLANETVAEYAFWSELPFVYRIHEAPSYEKISAFKFYAKTLGYTLKGKIDKVSGIHPKELERILEQAKGKPEERAISRNLLQSLMKAAYSPENLGHFGLAAKYYCHFTSPIRRYPDLAIHRILKSFLQGDMDSHKRSAFSVFAQKASKHSSDAEISAQNAERDVDDMLKAYYMSQFTGEEFEGIVSGIASFGMFVELDNTVEGLIRLQNMEEDYFIYNELNMTLVGEHFGKTYKIGDRVRVVLAGCDAVSRRIDFNLPYREETKDE